jgi:hypothetical protein
MSGRTPRISRQPSSREINAQLTLVIGGITSQSPLPIQLPPGSVVQYDRMANLPPEAGALARLNQKRTACRGQVISSSESRVEVIWENGRWGLYGPAPWYGRIECLQVVSRP